MKIKGRIVEPTEDILTVPATLKVDKLARTIFIVHSSGDPNDGEGEYCDSYEEAEGAAEAHGDGAIILKGKIVIVSMKKEEE